MEFTVNGYLVVSGGYGSDNFTEIINTVGQALNGTLAFEIIGNLVIYNNSNVIVWESSTSCSNCILKVQNNGNLVMFNQSGFAIWSSGTFNNYLAYNISNAEDGYGMCPTMITYMVDFDAQSRIDNYYSNSVTCLFEVKGCNINGTQETLIRILDFIDYL